MKTLKFFGAGKVMTTFLVLFMLLGVTLLSSCVATVRTPRYSGATVLVESQGHNGRQDRNERRKARHDQRQRDEHHD